MTALSDDQIGKLLAEAEGTPEATPLLVLVTLGVRRGGALALTWGDVDLAEGRVSVRRTLEESSAGIGVKEPKTARDANVPKEGCVSGLLGRPFPRDPPAPDDISCSP